MAGSDWMCSLEAEVSPWPPGPGSRLTVLCPKGLQISSVGDPGRKERGNGCGVGVSRVLKHTEAPQVKGRKSIPVHQSQVKGGRRKTQNGKKGMGVI